MTATDVTVIDTLDSNLTFVPNSFTVNGQTILNADLSTGVNIGSINGGTAAIVTFKLPLQPYQSTILFLIQLLQLIVTLLIQTSHLLQLPINLIQRQHKLIVLFLLYKSTNVFTVDIGQDIVYSVTIINSGNVSATNVIFTDLIPDGTSFEPNSFTLNGTTIPNADIITGVPIGDIAPNESAIVAFHISADEIPPINPISNQASVSFQHIVNPANPPVSKILLQIVLQQQLKVLF